MMATGEQWVYRIVLLITLSLILVEFFILTSISVSFYQFFIGLKPFFESNCKMSLGDFIIKTNFKNILKKEKPWYFTNGTIKPTRGDRRDIWPGEASWKERYFNQLMYIPTAVHSNKIKTINADNILQNKNVNYSVFSECPVDKCRLTHNKISADAVIFKSYIQEERDLTVRPEQVWVLYVSESPLETNKSNDNVNWTASYRYDSDIIVNNGQWVYYDKSIKTLPQSENFGEGKTKKVAWFVSNCESKNYRFEYVQELKKFIDVDIYGACGDKKCPENQDCLDFLAKNYKFYLAFEDANCRGYITNQFTAALKKGILPVVMGAHPNDYNSVAPFNSYIHVDYFLSAQELADYLHELDGNNNLFNAYFQWKGTGEFIDNFFYCRLCAMLHANEPPKHYSNFEDWWNPPGNCLLKQNDTWLPKLKDLEKNETRPSYLPREFDSNFKKYNNLD